MADNQANDKKRKLSPRKRKRIIFQRNKQTQFINSLKLPTSNKFSALADSENAMDTTEQQQQAPKKVYISPIVVTDLQANIHEILKELNLDFNFQLNSVGRNILPKSIDDKIKIIELLKKGKVNFYTHPDGGNKTFKVVLSGLPQLDTNDIETSIKEQKITPTKISMFNTKSDNKLYLLHFNASEVNKKTLEAVRYVCRHKVKWESFKPKRNAPTQCLRCLMYGHGIKSCNRYTVCMLCAGEHLTNACPSQQSNDTNTNVEYKCFNCMSARIPHNHKANDVNCPFRTKYEQAKNNARAKATTNQRAQTNTSPIAPAPQPPPLGVSFADSVRSAATASTSFESTTRNSRFQARAHTDTRFTNTSTRSNPSSNANTNPSGNVWTFDECANILFNSIEKLQRCSTKLDQLKVIAELLSHACK